jgi:hypothetical protein
VFYLFNNLDLTLEDIIEIRSLAKRNVLASTLTGATALLIASIVFTAMPVTFKLLGIFLTCAAIVAFLIAWMKFREPQFSFLISKQSIHYQHRNGQWLLNWENIQRIDIPKVNRGLQNESLDMLGIKIKSYSSFLDTVSTRLMSNILMEQRPLLLLEMSAKQSDNCSTGNCFNDDLLENDYFKSDCGKEYKGIQAMYANRMLKLRQRLGYDIFVSGSELDRPEQDFVDLLKQCQQQVVSQAELLK